MRILFDHNVPRKLRKHLKAHVVTTAAQMGWAEVENGQLIENAQLARFDVFVTGDQGMRYQQNHAHRRIPIVLITSTHWPDVNASSALIVEAIVAIEPGGFTIVEIRRKDQGPTAPSKILKTNKPLGGCDLD